MWQKGYNLYKLIQNFEVSVIYFCYCPHRLQFLFLLLVTPKNSFFVTRSTPEDLVKLQIPNYNTTSN